MMDGQTGDGTEISVRKDGKGVTQTLKGLDLEIFLISDETYSQGQSSANLFVSGGNNCAYTGVKDRMQKDQ